MELLRTILIGKPPGKAPRRLLYKYILLHSINIAGIINLFVFGTVALFLHLHPLAIIDYSAGLLLLGNTVYLHLSGRTERASEITICVGFALLLYLFVTGGLNHTGHLWLFVCPPASSYLLGYKKGLLVSAGLLFVSLASVYALQAFSPIAPVYPPAFLVRFALSYSEVSIFAFFYEYVMDKARRELSERTEEIESANERLGASERRLAYALDAASDGVWDWNIRTNAGYCSPSYFRMLGYEQGELANDAQSLWIDLLHPDEREHVVATVRQCLETEGKVSMEFRMRTRDGGYKWVLSRGKVVERDEGGRPLMVVGTHTDLTARKQMEIELRTAYDEQRAIFDSATTGIVFIKDRVIVRCNRKLEELFGYTPGELIGQTTRLWYPDEATFSEVGREVIQQLTDGGLHSVEKSLVRKDKTTFRARMSAQLVDPSDYSKGLVGIVEDITGEREASEALRRAKDAAEVANLAKSAFLANMSHEIRTPMNAILGLTELALDSDAQTQGHYLAKIHGSAALLLNILDDILDFSKIEAGKIAFEKVDFRILEVMEQLHDVIGPQAEEKNLSFSTRVGSDVPEILIGDPLRLSQLLMNLVNNAVKFTERGGVEVKVDVVQVRSEDVLVKFAVTDTGVGFSEEQKLLLFRSFSQADSSTTRRFGGTGLGLAICKRLVELMGGEIDAESIPGSESTFYFVIPLGLAIGKASGTVDHRSLHNQSQTPYERLNGIRILVVEDNKINQLVIKEYLERDRASVTIAENGQEAIDLIRQKPFDAILMDVQMPVMDGLQATKLLRKDSKFAGLPIIALTANVMKSDIEKCLAAGMNDHLGKPIKKQELLEKVLRWVFPPKDRAPAETVGLAVAETTPQKSHPDVPEAFEFEKALDRLGNNTSLFMRLLSMFIAGEKDIPDRVRAAMAAGDLVLVERLTHSLKTSSANLGAMHLSQAARKIEESLRVGAGVPEGSIDQLEHTHSEAMRKFKSILDAEANSPVNAPPYEIGLQEDFR
jgi:PAS domain S-box-containing protein